MYDIVPSLRPSAQNASSRGDDFFFFINQIQRGEIRFHSGWRTESWVEVNIDANCAKADIPIIVTLFFVVGTVLFRCNNLFQLCKASQGERLLRPFGGISGRAKSRQVDDEKAN